MEARWYCRRWWNDQGKINEFDLTKNEIEYLIYHHNHTYLDNIDFAHSDLNHVEIDLNILITFI